VPDCLGRAATLDSTLDVRSLRGTVRARTIDE
jgi:hypothetical protein